VRGVRPSLMRAAVVGVAVLVPLVMAAPGRAVAAAPACPSAREPLSADVRDRLLSQTVAPDTAGTVPTGPESLLVRRSLLYATRYIATTRWPTLPARHSTKIGLEAGNEALALAMATEIGGYGATSVGKPLSFARSLGVVLAVTTVCRHGSVMENGWGAGPGKTVPRDLHAYSSPHTAANVGLGAWLLWPHLSPDERYYVATMVASEADALLPIRPNYQYDRIGREIYKGDSKAEEDAWVSMALTLAVAMMPDHPNATRWLHKEVEFQLASYSSRADLTSDTVVNGGRLRDWLRGSNIRNNGTLRNHGIEHPLYMAAIHLKLNAVGIYGLTHTATPRSAVFNGSLVYGALVSHRYPSPPFLSPGGTAYRPGRSDIYYPQGNDWGTRVIGIYEAVDAAARAANLSPAAATFETLHTRGQLALQSRNADGRSYRTLSEFRYQHAEQWVAEVVARAWLSEWAAGNQRISIDDSNYFT
jgi:hypothetical protein